jgi:hypothetical protein
MAALAECRPKGPPYREGERAQHGEVTMEEAAGVLNVSEAAVRHLIKEKILPAVQQFKGAPFSDPGRRRHRRQWRSNLSGCAEPSCNACDDAAATSARG